MPQIQPLALSITHVTTYRYAAPVALSRQLLHLSPRNLPWQELLSHHIDITPAPSESANWRDYFGNPVTTAVISAPHRQLSIIAGSRVLDLSKLKAST